MPAFERTRGTVSAFDDLGGYGVVTDAEGGELGFHCTGVADGSRTIAVGTDVSFTVVPGRLGRWEATDLRPR